MVREDSGSGAAGAGAGDHPAGVSRILWRGLVCKRFYDWLYHKDCVARRHPVFVGLQAPGILDWDYYGPVISHAMFQGPEQPEEVMAAAFVVGYNMSGGYDSGVMMGPYRFGKGRLILNTLNLPEATPLPTGCWQTSLGGLCKHRVKHRQTCNERGKYLKTYKQKVVDRAVCNEV